MGRCGISLPFFRLTLVSFVLRLEASFGMLDSALRYFCRKSQLHSRKDAWYSNIGGSDTKMVQMVQWNLFIILENKTDEKVAVGKLQS
jgi:hypothetical protein